jgi:hypothetical protein
MTAERKAATCSKCQTEMEVGYVPDRSYGPTLLPTWYGGVPEAAGFWKASGIRRVLYSDGVPLSAYRCPKCSFVELYAFAPRKKKQ